MHVNKFGQRALAIVTSLAVSAATLNAGAGFAGNRRLERNQTGIAGCINSGATPEQVRRRIHNDYPSSDKPRENREAVERNTWDVQQRRITEGGQNWNEVGRTPTFPWFCPPGTGRMKEVIESQPQND